MTTELFTVLCLELIGYAMHVMHRQGNSQRAIRYGGIQAWAFVRSSGWVARIIGIDQRFGWKREFMKPMLDYSGANSRWTRGIIARYLLRPGIYDVFERTSWHHSERYFCRVGDGQIEKIPESAVREALCRS